jgi:hypothetical protein
MKGFLLVATLGLAGCLGQVDGVDAQGTSFAWLSRITVTPDAPTAGRHVSMDLHLTSKCTDPVHTDVALRVVHSSGRVLYVQTWVDVFFHPEEVWDLSQGFLPASDDRGTATIWVTVVNHDSGAVLWQDSSSSVTLR